METIHLTAADVMPDDEASTLEGTHLDERHYDRVVACYCRVNKPNGDPLAVYIPGVLPVGECRAAFEALKPLRFSSKNRISASGAPRLSPLRRDGEPSPRTQGRIVPSGVLGYLDRAGPEVCRQSALMRDHLSAFQAVLPLLSKMGVAFAQHLTSQWAAQWNFIKSVSPDFAIHGTPFTTVTVNRSWRTAAHRDEGDLRAGFGVLTVMGQFEGGALIFPKFRTAVDLRTGGVLLADVHELHGNAPLDVPPGHQRVSLVAYAREGMKACGSAADELARAQQRFSVSEED